MNSIDLSENEVVIFIRGGVVQWAARGPGRKIDLIIMDADQDRVPEIAVYGERCETGVQFDDDVSRALAGYLNQAVQA